MLRDELNSRGRLLAENPSGLTVFFDPKLSSIRTGSAKELERLGQAIKFDYRVRSIKIIGHSDDTGSKEENEKLSVSRAKTIESFLIAQGISTDQITVEGVSSAEPVATNKSEAGRQLNRRVEIYLIR
jgi:outer membrane protein OmpA-like peptidoglycan-associated protein